MTNKPIQIPPPPAGYALVTKGRSKAGDINWVSPKRGWMDCMDIGLPADEFRALARRTEQTDSEGGCAA